MTIAWRPWRRIQQQDEALTRLREQVAMWKGRAESAQARARSTEERAVALKNKRDELVGDLDRLRAQVQTALAASAALSTRLREMETQRSAHHVRFEQIRRAVLRSSVLRVSMPGRAGVAMARARLPEARQREEAFRTVSASYRAMAEAPPDPALRSTRIQGCAWWYPVISARQASPEARWAEKQKFPYRAITQTRELALGGIMLDIGANMGRMSISRALLGDVVAVYAAEPDPLNYAALVRNVRDNGLGGIVMPDQIAVGDKDGVAHLRRSQFAGGHRLVTEDAPDLIEVPIRTLDGWVDTLGVDLRLVTFVKMDVQGWERHVFDGAPRVLAQRHIAWQIELAPKVLRAAGTDPRDLVARMMASFTHFTDLSRTAVGPRARPVADLAVAMEYVLDGSTDQTDLLLFSADEAELRDLS